MTPSATAEKLAELQALAKQVPSFEAFLPVSELWDRAAQIADAAPSIVRWHRIGSSRHGEPIHELEVAGGDQHALVFAGVHPNEPIGSLTALHLATALSQDESVRSQYPFTWHIIPCIDPDGMRLNEGWFIEGVTRTEYARAFYRPAPDEQVEWTFPLECRDIYFDRVMPETLALMRLIDAVRPAFMCSLHNGELGGVYYYLSREAPGLYDLLTQLPAAFGLPLDTGEPEAPYIPSLAPGIYREIRMDEAYDYAASLGLDPRETIDAGDSSNSYTSKYGTFSLVSELPYWIHSDAENREPSTQNYDRLLSWRAEQLEELASLLEATLEASREDLKIDSPFLRASQRFAAHIATSALQEQRRAALGESQRVASVAEVFTGVDQIHCFRLRYGSMLIRALQVEVEAGNGTQNIRTALSGLRRRYDEWVAEAERAMAAEAVPIQVLVGLQFAAILAAGGYVAEELRVTEE